MTTLSPDPHTLLHKSQKRTRAVFGEEYTESIDVDNEPRYQTASLTLSDYSHRARIASKIRSEYEAVKELPYFLAEKQGKVKQSAVKPAQTNGTIQTKLIEDIQRSQRYFLGKFILIQTAKTSLPMLSLFVYLRVGLMGLVWDGRRRANNPRLPLFVATIINRQNRNGMLHGN
jgi:hypothetical protein